MRCRGMLGRPQGLPLLGNATLMGGHPVGCKGVKEYARCSHAHHAPLARLGHTFGDTLLCRRRGCGKRWDVLQANPVECEGAPIKRPTGRQKRCSQAKRLATMRQCRETANHEGTIQ